MQWGCEKSTWRERSGISAEQAEESGACCRRQGHIGRRASWARVLEQGGRESLGGQSCGLHPWGQRPARGEDVVFKKTKQRGRTVGQKEELGLRAGDSLPLGDQTHDGDCGSRLRARGQGPKRALRRSLSPSPCPRVTPLWRPGGPRSCAFRVP